MTAVPATPPARAARSLSGPVRSLALLEARHLLRHPATWLGILACGWWLLQTDGDWASARYDGYQAALTPMWLGFSVAMTGSFARGRSGVADDAPMAPGARAAARLLAGLVLVLLAAVVVGVGAVVLRAAGGVRLGDDPGRTDHAVYTLPELLQPVLLAAFAVALGAAVVHVVRSRAASTVVLTVFWFLCGATYWIFSGDLARLLAPLQVQPFSVRAGAWDADPATFPAHWLLSAPGEYQDYWARLVVSPWLAAWHDLYVVGLAAIAAGIALPGRARRVLVGVGLVVAVLGVGLQQVVAP
ncbi:hypothetical protein [Nocardioides daeguensis]|uniref:ABC transporter permease n=1 Tax=Nocardioides daeguensis TaxID=908359 RepID=A0ABP6UQD6_9ACTN|nr:hypothetical protein [Nocardioides daeguensis]MBV6728646.1 hypothetical protein [Nocardioides daeguensis]MCR1773745.1 hypothetical protein [Nocardioides daeguensis]